MIFGVLKECLKDNRIAIIPETIKKIKALYNDVDFHVEDELGHRSGFSNADFLEAGCKTEYAKKAIAAVSDVIFCFNLPNLDVLESLKDGAILIGAFKPLKNIKSIKLLESRNVTSFSLDLLPRITRAQSMDILSSQNSLAGYQAVILGASMIGKPIAMMMTAAGSLPAMKVLVIGAGVAGLQAIATARRLGAIVSAYDVRSVAKEQVQSLGATFVEIESEENGDTIGGYAKEMSEDYKLKQKNKLLEVIKTQDLVITTAQIPNKNAPKIIDFEMLEAMKKGALIIDLAGESGGNCCVTVHAETIVYNGVTIISPSQILNYCANAASRLYSNNIFSFFKTLLKFENAKVVFDEDDELVKSTIVTKNGKIVHEMLINK